jgi:hypothetical protein
LLSENVTIKIHRTIILPVVLYGCETWSLALREKQRLRVFEKRVLSRIFGPKTDETRGGWRKLHNEEHRITGVSDFIHRRDFNNYKKKEQTRRFGNWICFRPQVRGDTYSVGSLRKG